MRRWALGEGRATEVVTAANRGRMWVRAAVLIALVGAATQVPSVSAHAGHHLAAPPPNDIRYYMIPIQSRTTVCTGDSVTYRMAVMVEVTTHLNPPNDQATMDVIGVKVEAFPDDAALGTFNPTSTITAPFRGGMRTADFTFKAGTKPGKTILEFQGAITGSDIHVGYVSFRIPIRVVECKFKVSGVVFFPPDETYVPLPAPPLEGTIRPTQLTADADGHLSAQATIHWGNGKTIANVPPILVTATSKFGADQEVTVNGDVSDEGILTLTFEFPQADGTITWTGAGMTIPSVPSGYLVDTVTVHVSTDGGTMRLPARYKDSGAGGTATIVVKKVKS